MRALAILLLMIAAPAWAQSPPLPGANVPAADDPMMKRFADDWVALDGALNAAEVAKSRVAEDLNAILKPQKKAEPEAGKP